MADAAATPTVATGRADPLLETGQFIDTFRITRPLGEGAMGQVYLALDEQLGRRVALKFIKTGLLDYRALERFRDEARTTDPEICGAGLESATMALVPYLTMGLG